MLIGACGDDSDEGKLLDADGDIEDIQDEIRKTTFENFRQSKETSRRDEADELEESLRSNMEKQNIEIEDLR